MTEQNKHSDKTLEQLYTERKAQYTAPASIKRHLLVKQQASINSRYIFRRISYVATAACTLLLFGLFSLQQMQNSTPPTFYSVIHIHSLDTQNTPVTTERQEINARYAKRYKEYLKQQNTFALHHNKQAMLKKMDNGWQLKTCDDEIMFMSNELVAALANIHQLDQKLNSGDIVNIAFDSSGIILTVGLSNKQMLCS